MSTSGPLNRDASPGSGGLTFERVAVEATPVRARSGLSALLSGSQPMQPQALPTRPPTPEPQRWLAHPTGQRLRGYLHMTSSGNLQDIHDEGLIADKKKGFGSPQDGGMRERQGVYVVDDPAFYKGDVASGHVGVVSTQAPISDSNYPHSRDFTRHGAGYFMDRVAPLRDAITEGHGPSNPYSFTLPMTPRTEAGAQRLLKATDGRELDPSAAADEVGGVVTDRYPLYFGDRFLPTPTPRQPSSMGPIVSDNMRMSQSGLGLPSSFPVLTDPSEQRAANAGPVSALSEQQPAVTKHAWPPVIHEDYFK